MAFSRRSFCRLLGMATGVEIAGGLAGHDAFLESPPAASRFLRLDRNENPYGPPPKVVDAIQQSAQRASRYAHSDRDSLAEAIARFHRVGREQVLLGAGSTDLQRMAAQAFLGPDRPLVLADPTFSAMEHYARFTQAPLVKTPLTRELAHDLEAMRAAMPPATGLVYLCNPNNPTGTLTSRKRIEKFVSSLPGTAVVVLDEAYHEYAARVPAAYASFIEQAPGDGRLVVLRTFSKAYGLAGLRLGYAVGAPTTLEKMRAFATEDCINSLAVPAGLAALESQDSIRDWVKRNDDDRQEFFNRAGVRMLKPIDSHTNFIFMDALRPAEIVIQHFRQHGICLGPVFPSMPHHVRISLGAPEDMIEFWRVWDLLPIVDAPM